MTEEDKALSKVINHFPTYLEYVYSNIGLPSPTPLQHRIAEHINENPKRIILEAARGTGKSWIMAIYTTWRILRNRDEKIIILSASGPKAIEIATFVRSLFENVPLLFHLRPDKNQRDSILSFDVSGCKPAIAPSISALGITGQITGKRASLILADDVEVPANSMTELMREKLMSRVNELEALLIPDMPNSIIFAGTPQSMESIYNKLEYQTVILPAEVPEDPMVYEGKLDDWIMMQGKPGEATDKVRFSKEILDERKAGMGPIMYKLQYMLDTTLSDAEKFPLKTGDMIVHPLDKLEGPMTITYTSSKSNTIDIPSFGFTGDRYHKPLRVSEEHMKWDKLIMSIDPSGSGSDETTYCVMGVLSGNLFVLDFGGTREGYSDEALLFLADKALEWKVNEVVPEKNFGSGMFTELFKKVLQKVHPCYVVDDFNVKGQKEVRIIDNILPILSNHQIVFNEEIIMKEAEWVQKNPVENLVYSLMYQLTHITYDKGSLVHDDRLDALAIACQYLSEYVIVSATDRLEGMRLQEELDMINAMISGNLHSFTIGTQKTSLGNWMDNPI